MGNFSPNLLSASRLACAPLVALVFWLPDWFGMSRHAADIAAAALFGVAAASDFVDGWLARKHGSQSRLGAFLDPAADKILVVTSLLLLLDAERAAVEPVLFIVLREVVVSALREWAALAKISASVRVSGLGKWKAAAQMTAIPCLLAGEAMWEILAAEAEMSSPLTSVGTLCLWVSAGLAGWSMIDYCLAAWRAYRASK